MKAFFVTRRLAFGSAITSWSHVERLQTLGITHVINLRFSTHSKKVRQFKALWLPFHDDAKPHPKWFYRKARKFYRKAMKKPGSRVFVMCHHGLCRSPSMVYFLLRVSGVTPRQAEALVLKARPNARVVRAYRESGENFLKRVAT